MNVKLLLALVPGLVIPIGARKVLAQNLRITIPLHSELTPVQRLNRAGVNAVSKQSYEKAEGLFYKAYLYDPADPFTLNNLGYVAELQGQIDRAEEFYRLATSQGCYAIIDRSTQKELKGKPMMDALGTLKNVPMRVNRINVLGIQLLSQDRPFEAQAAFKEALALDAKNPFSLNNLGVAEEAIGDLEGALKHYEEAAASQSLEPIVVTLKRSSRGKPVSQAADESGQNLSKRMQKMSSSEIRAAMLATHGVFATNSNDWNRARQDFLEAYALDPQSAFALNNRGYVAERDGDLESASSYYARAQKADDASARVGMATQTADQGRQISAVADESRRDVASQLDAFSEKRRGQKGQTELKRRNNNTQNPEPSPEKPSNTPAPDLSTPLTPHSPEN